jgi:isoquinoline 1-oxidoreductase subunit alpha
MTKLTVNDRPVEYKMDSATPLLWALRDASNLTGTKFGCGQGDCGACIVDIDGEALKSCMVTLAEAEGRFVTTIEKLSVDRSHPLQQAFVAAGAVQCGFCTPGMIMAASALLKRNANPTDADIDEAIANICRCGVYPRLRDAVQRAARVMRRESTLAAVPPPGITPEDAAAAVPAIKVRQSD